MVSKRQILARRKFKQENPDLFPKPEATPPKDPNKKKKNSEFKRKKNDPKKPSTKKHPLRIPGMKPGDSCFICKADNHIAKNCPEKAQWEKHKEGDHLKNYTTYGKSELARMPGIDSIAGKGKQKTGQTSPNTHPKKPRVPKMPPHPKKQPVPKERSGSKRKKQKLMQSTTNWFDLPLDLKKNILSRVGVVERLWTVQKVCTDWHEMCKEPSMWRVIYMTNELVVCCWPYDVPSGLPISQFERRGAWEMCRNAVDRSQGQLVDITMAGICDDELLEYVADGSSQLRSLRIAFPRLKDGSLSKALKKLPFLEELSIYLGAGSLELDIEALGKYCPMLRTLELIDMSRYIGDEEVIAIGENLPELRHLQIIKNFKLSNTGLQAILDGCHCLEVLDLRLCSSIDLKGDVGTRLEHIECVLHTEPYRDPYMIDYMIDSVMDLETYRKRVNGEF